MRTHLAACLTLALLLAGCGGGGSDHSVATVAAPAAAAPAVALSVALSDATDEASIVAFHTRLLAAEVGLDADGEARVAAILSRAWADAQAEVQGRVDAVLPVDEEAVSAILLAHQRAADLEIAGLLTPAQRARFEELGGRISSGAATGPLASAGGAR